MLDRDLEHPDVTQARRTGFPGRSRPEAGAPACARCGEPVAPGHERFGLLLEFNGGKYCPDCFEEALLEDLHHDPAAFAQSLLLEVERF